MSQMPSAGDIPWVVFAVDYGDEGGVHGRFKTRDDAEAYARQRLDDNTRRLFIARVEAVVTLEIRREIQLDPVFR